MDIWNTSICPLGIEKVKEGINNNISNIFTGNQFMKLYTDVYDCLIQNNNDGDSNSKKFYDNHTEEIKKYLFELKGLDINFENKFERFDLFNKWLGRFLMYLNRYYVIKNSLHTLEQKGIKLFNQYLFCDEKNNLITIICLEINKERDGQIISIHNLINIFKKMNSIIELENNYLEYLTIYYKSKVDSIITSNQILDYLRVVEKIKLNEFSKLEIYSFGIDKIIITQILNDIFYTNKIIELKVQLIIIFSNENSEEIRLVYSIFKSINIDFICELFNNYISNKITYNGNIKELIDRYNYVINLIQLSFDNDINISKVICNYMKSLLSKITNISEEISNYCDTVLNKNSKDVNPESILKNILTLIKYIPEKDMFIEHYRNKLAKRLIHNKSQCYDLEKFSISQIKFNIGLSSTSKLEGMINDIVQTNNSEFNHNILKVSVLTQGFWPSIYMPKLIFPSEMEQYIDSFDKYYKSCNSSKRIEWLHWISTVIVNRIYNGTKYEIQMTVPQYLILIFMDNENRSYNIDEFKHLGLEIKYIKGLLHSLSCTKYKLLNKSTNNNSIKDDDTFMINYDFHSNLRKFQIPFVTINTENVDSSKIDENRSIQLDACIVRIMKSRKIIKHNDLIPEIKKQMTLFEPELSMIKKRIGCLIEKEFIERNENDSSMYNYLP